MAKVSRFEFLSRLGVVTIADKLMRETFDEHEERLWREEDEAPHGARWSTSFHASSFPGDDPRSCPRYLVYGLMDVPDKEPAPMRLRAQAELGEAIEKMIVERYGSCDVLLTANLRDGDEHQTVLTEKDVWLTCAPDSVVVPRGWDRPHPIEIKTKKQEVVEEMQRGERGPDEKHIRQLKTQIAMTRRAQEQGLWADRNLKPCADGTIFYLARTDDPTSCTWEFLYSYDDRFWEAGVKVLEGARDSFLRGELPPHPFGGKEWSVDPCKYCRFKRNVCRPDEANDVVRLDESHANNWAKEVRGSYDYEDQRRQVLERWGVDDPLAKQEGES